MAKEDSKLTRDLEQLNRRIQASKISLRQTEIRAGDLDASIQAARLAVEPRKPKRVK